MSDSDAEFYIGEEARLRLTLSLFYARWEQIRYFIWPDSTSFFGTPNQGQGNRLQILDNSAEDAAELAAAGLHGLITNSASQWFHYSLLNQDVAELDGPMRWLDMATRRVHALFNYAPSRFNVASYRCYQEAIAFGNWCMFVEERRATPENPGGLPLFRAINLVDVVWDEDEDGTIAKVYRRFHLPLWAAYRKFGNRLPKVLLKLHEDRKNHHRLFKFLHCVVPREEGSYDRRIPNARNKPWASHWIAVDQKETIVEGGYDEMPYICGRWRVLPGELMGRGCGDKALPDAALLQRGTGAFIDAAEIIGQPPFALPDKGMTKKLNLRRRALNYVRPDYLMQNGGPRPLLTGGDTRVTEEMLAQVRDRIQRAFLRDLLQLIRDPEATATQILKIEQEQMRGMSPILAQIAQDWLGPLVMRTFGVAQRAGAFADMPVPRELVGMVPKPIFVSPAARAQQLAEASGIAQGYDAAHAMIEADPSVLDNVDVDKQFRTVMVAVGTPLSTLRPPEEVAQRKQARANVQQQQQQLEGLKDLTTGAKNAAPMLKAISDASANRDANLAEAA